MTFLAPKLCSKSAFLTAMQFLKPNFSWSLKWLVSVLLLTFSDAGGGAAAKNMRGGITYRMNGVALHIHMASSGEN